MKLTPTILLVLCLFSIRVFAQERSIFDQYYLNSFIINPASTGSEYYPKVCLSYKRQWLGINNSPKTFLLAGDYRIGTYNFYNPKQFINKTPLLVKDRVAVGGALFHDTEGPVQYLGNILSTAYHLPVSFDSRLSLGFSAIFGMYSLNSEILQPTEKQDPYLYQNNNNVTSSNINIGVKYYTNKYYIGIATNKLIKTNNNIQNTGTKPSYFLTGGYKFLNKRDDFNLEPSIAIKKIAEYDVILDIHTKLYIKKFNWLAISVSSKKSMGFIICTKLYKKLSMAYNYKTSFNEIGTYSFGTHEINLGINLGLRAVEGIRQTK